MVIAAGLYKETKWQTLIQGSIAVVMGAVLAPIWGLPGIIIGSILSNVYRDIDLLFFIPKHVTRLAPKITLKRWVLSMVELVMILVPFYVLKIEITTVMQWLIAASAAVLLGCFVIFLVSRIFYKRDLSDSLLRIVKVMGFKNA